MRNKFLLLLAVPLALASPWLEAGSLKVTVAPQASAKKVDHAADAIEEGMTRSLNAGVHVPPAGPGGYDIAFDRIVNNQSLSGSDVYLLAQAGFANPVNGFSITHVLPAFTPAGAVQLSAQPFVMQNPATVNGVAANGFDNPLYNVAPTFATVLNNVLVATSPTNLWNNTLFAVPITTPNALISTAFLGAAPAVVPVNQQFTPLKDAGGNDIQEIRGLVAGADAVYAAVSQGANGFFADAANNRGIAKVTVGNNVLTQPVNASAVSLQAVDAVANAVDVGAAFATDVAGIAARAGSSTMAAATFDVAGSFGNGLVPGGQGVVMHYNSVLKRVFVGFKGLRKNVRNLANAGLPQEGGLIGILVGEPGAVINFRSILHNPTPEVFSNSLVAADAVNQNRRDSIVGLYHGPQLGNAVVRANQLRQNADVYVSVHQLNSMNTSTGKTYLIVASEIGSLGANAVSTSGLFCVPVMGEQDFNAAGQPGGHKAAATEIGKVAAPDFTSILSGGADIPAAANNVHALATAASYPLLPLASTNCITNTLEILDNGASRVRKIQVNAQQIADLKVVGDTVFFAVNGNEAVGQLQGAYQTTALFDRAGNIKSWTPLQRISSINETVAAMAIDTVTGTPIYIDNATHNTLRVADWATNTDASKELIAMVTKYFPAAQGGVRGIYSFDSNTPTFAGGLINSNPVAVRGLNQQDKACSLLVVLGYDKVMVVQTAFGNFTAQHFSDLAAPAPATFAGPMALAGGVAVNTGNIQNVFVFDSTTNPDLKKIAPLTCAEVLKVVPQAAGAAHQNQGYIYVGGFGGVCRLEATVPVADSAAADGLPAIAVHDGWATRNDNVLPRLGAVIGAVTGLDSVHRYVGSGAGYQFTQLVNPALKDVRKIVSMSGDPATLADSCALGVLMGDGIMSANGTELALPAAVIKRPLPLNTTYAFDAVIVKNMAALGILKVAGINAGLAGASAVASKVDAMIFATEQGLVVSAVGAPALVPLDGGDMPIQLAYEARDRGGVAGGGDGTPAGGIGGAGVLYVLAGSQATGTVRMHRFAVNYSAVAGNVLTPIARPTVVPDSSATALSLQMFRRCFGTDGLQFLFGRDYAVDNTEMLNQVLLPNATTAPLSLTSVLGKVGLADAQGPGSFINAPLRESVSGAWLVPGSFGLKVND